MWFAHKSLGISAGGLFSPDLAFQPWSLERVWDMLTHLFVPGYRGGHGWHRGG